LTTIARQSIRFFQPVLIGKENGLDLLSKKVNIIVYISSLEFKNFNCNVNEIV
jgi:hypothetical protein